jgi:hypothetical protein
MKHYRIRSFEVQFLGKSGFAEEYHRTKFYVPPICVKPENVYETIKDSIQKAIGKDKRKKIIVITTAQGKFYFSAR